MNKKGFTLVELLAVIVILSIIAIITIPMIKGVIDKVKLGSLEDSVYGLKSAAELYFSSNEKVETTEFICNDNGCLSDTGKKLDYKGKVEGKIKLFSDGKVSICLTSDNYASSILANEKKATTKMGGCDEETYEISEVIAIEKYNEIKNDLDSVNNDFLSVKNTLYNKEFISNVDNNVNKINEEINSVELGRNEEQLKEELYDKLQYSGLVTSDMTYDEMLGILENHFPNVPDTFDYFNSTVQSDWKYTSNAGTMSVSKGSSNILLSQTPGYAVYWFLIYCSKGYKIQKDTAVLNFESYANLYTDNPSVVRTVTVAISTDASNWTDIFNNSGSGAIPVKFYCNKNGYSLKNYVGQTVYFRIYVKSGTHFAGDGTNTVNITKFNISYS